MNISPVGYSPYSNTAFGKKEKPPKMTHKEKQQAKREERVSDPHYNPHRIGKVIALWVAGATAIAAHSLIVPPAQSPGYQDAANAFSSDEIAEFVDKTSLFDEVEDRFFNIETSFDTQEQIAGFEAKYYYNNGLNIGNISGRITVSEENSDELIIELNDSQKDAVARYSMNITKNNNVDRIAVFQNLDDENESYTYSGFNGKAPSLKDKNGKEIRNDKADARNIREAAGVAMQYVIPTILSLASLNQLLESIKDRLTRRRLATASSGDGTDEGGE